MVRVGQDKSVNRATIAVAVLGLLCVAAGMAARAGLWRGRWVDRYRYGGFNGVFILITAGLGFLLISPATSCGGPNLQIKTPCQSGVIALGVVIGLGLWVFSLGVYFVKPPSWLKPSWLRHAEANDWKEDMSDTPSRIGTAIALLSLVVLIAIVALLAWPGKGP